MLEPTILTAAIIDPARIIHEFLSADAMTVYLLVLGLMVIESSFIPFPSEVIVPPAAYLACTSHEVSITLVILLATAGALIGALINYGLSLWVRRARAPCLLTAPRSTKPSAISTSTARYPPS